MDDYRKESNTKVRKKPTSAIDRISNVQIEKKKTATCLSENYSEIQHTSTIWEGAVWNVSYLMLCRIIF